MKKIITLVFILLISIVKGQTLETIIKKHIEAVGGRRTGLRSKVFGQPAA